MLALTLASLWLAVRPPRLVIALAPAEYGLAVEDVAIRADDGVRLAGWFTRPSPAEAAARVRISVPLVHSRGDAKIPFAHAEGRRAALGTNRGAEFELMARRRHGELPARFEARLADFFRRVLAKEVVS